MEKDLTRIREIILEAAEKARQETDAEPEPELTKALSWPITCSVGPGLEGAIACESKVGYVNGSKGWLIYRGYNIFDLCAYSTFEEVSYLLLHGRLPNESELKLYKQKLFSYSHLNKSLRLLMGFPVEQMHVMAALRLGTNLMRQEFTILDKEEGRPDAGDAIASDEDSIAMESIHGGSERAVFEFGTKPTPSDDANGIEACIHLIAGVSNIIGAIARLHNKKLPLEPHPELSHAANLLYMITGKIPSPVEERITDICLILHADHGMNASTFASMVVASTMADIYFSVGSGIGALSGPLHGGANEAVIHNLREIGSKERVRGWVEQKLAAKSKISGFGHRVYKAYDPRARILGPLARFLAKDKPDIQPLYETASELENVVLAKLGTEKKIFPNVDFYSGLVYSSLGIDYKLFTPLFAASRVAGWTARVLEYMQNNRIFRPRSLYTGEFNKKYVPMSERLTI
ncbi:MAG: citrate/2-methylcitrate synthase [Desulfobacteraceae bacterium]|nr:citrate/2-methylcitrate synthase [Desulfobacteraceae bacterium]